MISDLVAYTYSRIKLDGRGGGGYIVVLSSGLH